MTAAAAPVARETEILSRALDAVLTEQHGPELAERVRWIHRNAAELREVLRTEGIQLDERLGRAEQEREQFLFALEDQHARQIRGLAEEYQHEASTILRGLIEQLAAEQIQPLIDEIRMVAAGSTLCRTALPRKMPSGAGTRPGS